MTIFPDEKSYLDWKRQRGVKHDKDRVSYRKSDGTRFCGPRNAAAFKPRERDYCCRSVLTKLLNQDFGWRADLYERFGSVQDEAELHAEYIEQQAELEHLAWAKKWMDAVPPKQLNALKYRNDFLLDIMEATKKIRPFYPPVIDSWGKKVFVFVTNAEEMRYIAIAEEYGFDICPLPESFAMVFAILLS